MQHKLRQFHGKDCDLMNTFTAGLTQSKIVISASNTGTETVIVSTVTGFMSATGSVYPLKLNRNVCYPLLRVSM
jgi:hypothetical protein